MDLTECDLNLLKNKNLHYFWLVQFHITQFLGLLLSVKIWQAFHF